MLLTWQKRHFTNYTVHKNCVTTIFNDATKGLHFSEMWDLFGGFVAKSVPSFQKQETAQNVNAIILRIN